MAVEAIVKVKDKGKQPRIKKRVTFTDGSIIVETIDEDVDDDAKFKEAKRNKGTPPKRNVTAPVGGENRTKPRRKKSPKADGKTEEPATTRDDDVAVVFDSDDDDNDVPRQSNDSNSDNDNDNDNDGNGKPVVMTDTASTQL